MRTRGRDEDQQQGGRDGGNQYLEGEGLPLEKQTGLHRAGIHHLGVEEMAFVWGSQQVRGLRVRGAMSRFRYHGVEVKSR